MLERRGSGEEFPVALVGEDRAPVGDVGERGEGVAADALELARLGEEAAIDGDGRHEREQRRKEAPRAAAPERGEGDAPRLAVLGEQERGDEKPREHEEEIDAQVAARQRAVGVKEEHPQERRPRSPSSAGRWRIPVRFGETDP